MLLHELYKPHRKRSKIGVSLSEIFVNVNSTMSSGETPQSQRDAIDHKHDGSELSAKPKSKKVNVYFLLEAM